MGVHHCRECHFDWTHEQCIGPSPSPSSPDHVCPNCDPSGIGSVVIIGTKWWYVNGFAAWVSQQQGKKKE